MNALVAKALTNAAFLKGLGAQNLLLIILQRTGNLKIAEWSREVIICTTKKTSNHDNDSTFFIHYILSISARIMDVNENCMRTFEGQHL
jgi:hypothetical protein